MRHHHLTVSVLQTEGRDASIKRSTVVPTLQLRQSRNTATEQTNTAARHVTNHVPQSRNTATEQTTAAARLVTNRVSQSRLTARNNLSNNRRQRPWSRSSTQRPHAVFQAPNEREAERSHMSSFTRGQNLKERRGDRGSSHCSLD